MLNNFVKIGEILFHVKLYWKIFKGFLHPYFLDPENI